MSFTLLGILNSQAASVVEPFLGFIAMGQASPYATKSADGITWTTTNNPLSNEAIRAAAFGDGKWVVVGGDFSGNDNCAVSIDAENWTRNDIPSTRNEIQAVNYGNGLWVAVGNDTDKCYTSSDAVSWTARTIPTASDTLYDVIYGPQDGIWVIVGGRPYLSTSPDGITWTVRSHGFPSLNNIFGAAYNGSRYVVAGGRDGNEARISYSDNGTSWTNQTVSVFGSDRINDIAYGNNVWVIVRDSGGDIATSSDGINYTLRTTPTSDSIYAIGFANGLFATGGSSGQVMTSSNGITWTFRTSGFGSQFVFGMDGSN